MMMKYFSVSEKQDLRDIVREEYLGTVGEIAVNKGIDLVVKLVNCKVAGQIDDGAVLKDYLKTWGERNLSNFEFIEKVMEKLVALYIQENVPIGAVIEGCENTFTQCLCKLNIMSALDNKYLSIKAASQNWNINRDRKHLYEQYGIYNPTADRVQWKDCTCSHAYMYLWAWKYRERAKTANEWLETDEILLARKSFFTVLLDLCLRNEKLIESCYLETLEESVKQDFREIKMKSRLENDRTQFFTDVFSELDWGIDEADGLLWDDKHRAILLIGEGGAGKTTQMEKLYWEELCAESESRLPVWVNVRDLKDRELLKEIQNILGKKLGDSCEELMENGMISLYLDGLNELILDDRGSGENNLVRAITDLINKYEKLFICMTDRTSEKLTRLVKGNKVTVYKCQSMDEEDAREYCKKYYGADEADMIVGTVKNPNESEWFWDDDQHVVTPGKINALAKMVLEGYIPNGATQYYKYYIERVLKRELEEKGDYRVPDLGRMLHKLTTKMEYNFDAKYRVDIIDIFADVLENDVEKANEYFELACQIPLLVEQESAPGTYLFPYYGFFSYFRNLEADNN